MSSDTLGTAIRIATSLAHTTLMTPAPPEACCYGGRNPGTLQSRTVPFKEDAGFLVSKTAASNTRSS